MLGAQQKQRQGGMRMSGLSGGWRRGKARELVRRVPSYRLSCLCRGRSRLLFQAGDDRIRFVVGAG